MAGAVALPLVVEVAFGAEPLDTGTLTWTDISDFVRRTSGVDFSRGWDTESDEPLAGRLTFTLNNDDGDFTPGETGAYGEIRNRLPVRVSAVIGTATGNALTYDEAVGWYDMLGATYDDTEIGTVVLWTGLVESWRMSWENGVRPQVQVTAVDRWAAIRRVKIPTDTVLEAAKATGASIVFPCTEDAAPMRDLTGALVVNTQDGDPSYAVAVHPTDASKRVVQTVPSAAAETPVYATGDHSVATGFSITVFIRPSGAVASVQPMAKLWGYLGNALTHGYAYVGLIHTGGILVARGVAGRQVNASPSQDWSLTVNGSTALADDMWHAVTLTLSLSGGVVTNTVYVDGTLAGTVSSSSGRGDWPAGWVRGFQLDHQSVERNIAWGGVIVHDRALTADEAKWVTGQVASWAGDTAAVRAAKLKLFTSLTLTTTGTFTSTMSAQDLGDKSLADALMECATAEDGTIYMGADGWPVLTSRSWRTGNSVAFTIPASALAADLTFTLDDQQLINSATVDRMVREETAGTVKATADASIATYGEQNRQLQVWLDTDAQHLERANAEANQWANPLVRSSDLMVDILTKNATISASTMLGADIGQRIAVSGMPSEAPSATQFFIESISDRVTHTGWERTFTVSPRLDYFTIGDATFGVIDSTNVLAF